MKSGELQGILAGLLVYCCNYFRALAIVIMYEFTNYFLTSPYTNHGIPVIRINKTASNIEPFSFCYWLSGTTPWTDGVHACGLRYHFEYALQQLSRCKVPKNLELRAAYTHNHSCMRFAYVYCPMRQLVVLAAFFYIVLWWSSIGHTVSSYHLGVVL